MTQRVVLVTGSTRGLGLAIAQAFVAVGDRVVVHGRSQGDADRVAAELGGGAIGVAAELTSLSGPELVDAAIRQCGRLDVLVNNAGIAKITPALEVAPEEWHSTLDLNLSAVFFCSQRAARHMLANGGGSIVNIASIAGRNAGPARAAYSASKAAVLQLSKVLALEWAPTVRVNCVLPGFIDSALGSQLEAEGKRDTRAVRNRLPMRRLAEPEEVARAVTFLASEASSYTTGAELAVDGGWLAHGFTDPAPAAGG